MQPLPFDEQDALSKAVKILHEAGVAIDNLNNIEIDQLDTKTQRKLLSLVMEVKYIKQMSNCCCLIVVSSHLIILSNYLCVPVHYSQCISRASKRRRRRPKLRQHIQSPGKAQAL